MPLLPVLTIVVPGIPYRWRLVSHYAAGLVVGGEALQPRDLRGEAFEACRIQRDQLDECSRGVREYALLLCILSLIRAKYVAKTEGLRNKMREVLLLFQFVMVVVAKERAILEIVLYEHVENGELKTYKYQLSGHFTAAGAKSSAEGTIVQVR